MSKGIVHYYRRQHPRADLELKAIFQLKGKEDQYVATQTVGCGGFSYADVFFGGACSIKIVAVDRSSGLALPLKGTSPPIISDTPRVLHSEINSETIKDPICN